MNPRICVDMEQRYERRRASADDMYEYLIGLSSVSEQQFEAGLSGALGPDMNERYGGILVENNLWETALRFALHKDVRVAFRASWALEWAYFNNGELFAPYAERLLDNYLKSTNHSVHRHYTKMLCDMMRRDTISLNDSQMEQVVEKTFDLLISPETKAATKVWCGEVLFDLSPCLPWIEDHLADVVAHQIETNPTPAIVNHGNKLLRRIDQRRKNR